VIVQLAYIRFLFVQVATGTDSAHRIRVIRDVGQRLADPTPVGPSIGRSIINVISTSAL
jgi:hypothetical protein